MMDVKVSKNTSIADGLIERISSILDEIKSKTMHTNEESDWYRKKKPDTEWRRASWKLK